MIERHLRLPAEWVPSAPDGIRAFQARVRDIADQAEEALVLHAPTGAGKTHALRLWIDRHGKGFREARSLLVVTPTNALAAEIQADLTRQLDDNQPVLRWTAQDIRDRHGNRYKPHALSGDARDAAVIVTNPDNLHRFTNHAFLGSRSPEASYAKLRPAWRALENVGLMVVDEYHAYDEQLLASLLLLVLKLRASQNPPKFLFLSATPNEALPELLRRFDISCRHCKVESQPNGDGKPIKYELNVTITNQPLLEVISTLDRGKRTLVVFDRFTDLLRTRALQSQPDVGTITGRDTSLLEGGRMVGQADWSGKRLLLATSKVDVGLNIPDVEQFHIQPGFHLRQSWQRFGRAGRDRSARIVLHIDRVGDEVLAQYQPETKKDLEDMLSAFLPEERSSVLRVQEWMARFLAYYHHNTPPDHGHRTVQLDDVAVEHGRARVCYAQTLSLLTATLAGRLSGKNGEWNERRWQQEVGRVLGRLRGDQFQVEVHYPDFHADGQTSRDDLVYVLRWTDHTVESWDDRTVHVVTGIRDSPQDVLLHYPVYGLDRCPVPSRGIVPDRKAWRAWTQQLASKGQYQTRGFRETLGEWLEACGPGTIRPLEAMADDQIL